MKKTVLFKKIELYLKDPLIQLPLKLSFTQHFLISDLYEIEYEEFLRFYYARQVFIKRGKFKDKELFCKVLSITKEKLETYCLKYNEYIDFYNKNKLSKFYLNVEFKEFKQEEEQRKIFYEILDNLNSFNKNILL